jgi:4'-phosphopantetheinyl transferase
LSLHVIDRGKTVMNNCWQSMKRPASLAINVIHVWRASLAADENVYASLGHTLSASEKQRAAGFKFETDRRHFVIAHGVLRHLLAAYLGAQPENLVLVPDSNGKPRLTGQAGDSIRFNLSRSGEMALCAFACGREVGVDVEKIAREVDELAIARRMFTPSEADRLATLQGEERTAAFFNSWTRLEALVKASGRGLGSMAQEEFSLPQKIDDARKVEAKGGSGHEPVWQIVSLQPGLDYAGAVAAEGTDWTIQCLDWSYA